MRLNLVINNFLVFNGYSKSLVQFGLNYNSHPNYPSLYAITDTLSTVGIENIAVYVPKSHLMELPINFLAAMGNTGEVNRMVLVNRTAEKIRITTADNVTRNISIDEFSSEWTGLVVAVEPGSDKKMRNSNIYKISALVLGLSAVFILASKFYSAIEIYHYCISVFGFLISILIVQEKLQTSQQITLNICSFAESTSCESVIRSDKTKLFEWLDFSDLPIIFFGGAVLANAVDASAYGMVSFISVLSIPIIIYSIYLQKEKLKKWCVLCLGVSGLLILNSMSIFTVRTVSVRSGLVFFVALLLTAAIWFYIKDNLQRNSKLMADNNELSRFKRNHKVFESLATPLEEPLQDGSFRTIKVGKASSLINIALIISPGCGYCHASLAQAVELYESNTSKNGMTLSVFYNINPDNKDNPYLQIAKNTMQVNSKSPEKAFEALKDWHLKKMDAKEWLEKWKQENIEDDIITELRDQYKWCHLNGFNFTPIVILGQNQYPKEYTIEDLKFFIKDIEAN